MITSLLAQVDPKFIERAAIGTGAAAKENPLWVVVIALGAIVAVMLLAVIWWIRKGHPDTMTARAAAIKAGAERAEADRKARAEEKSLDRQLLKEVALASITQAQDGARAAVSEAHRTIGERVADVKDVVTAGHEINKSNQTMIRAIGVKLGLPMSVGLVMGLSAAAPVEVASIADMGAAAPQSVIAEARPVPPPSDPDVCNPRCPAPQVCSGRICTIMVRPKQPRPIKRPPVRKLATAPGQPERDPAPAGPTSWNVAVLSTSWTDGRDPFAVEPEVWP